MKPVKDYLHAGSEMRTGELCVGRSNTMMFLYTRYRPRTARQPKQYVPSVKALNYEFGTEANIQFMRRHELPATMRDIGGQYVTPTQLVGNLFFLDKDDGRYYWARCVDQMDMRQSRRHFVSWERSLIPTTYVEPKQMIMRSIETVSKKELRAFAEWFKELEGAEEAINILEPDRERLRSARQTLLAHDFCSMIREAYLAGSNPASVLADIGDRDYHLPPVNHCNIGTISRYHLWLQAA